MYIDKLYWILLVFLIGCDNRKTNTYQTYIWIESAETIQKRIEQYDIENGPVGAGVSLIYFGGKAVYEYSTGENLFEKPAQ